MAYKKKTEEDYMNGDYYTDEYYDAERKLDQAEKDRVTLADYKQPTVAKDVLSKYLNTPDFKYDLNSDIIYNQYKDQYTGLAKLASKSAAAQAAAMTGGYGNSYAETVGAQAFGEQMGKVNDIIPSLYSLALSKYESDKQGLYDRYKAVKAEEDDAYSKHVDLVNESTANIKALREAKDSIDARDTANYNTWLSSQATGDTGGDGDKGYTGDRYVYIGEDELRDGYKKWLDKETGKVESVKAGLNLNGKGASFVTKNMRENGFQPAELRTGEKLYNSGFSAIQDNGASYAVWYANVYNEETKKTEQKFYVWSNVTGDHEEVVRNKETGDWELVPKKWEGN